ncbi:MAG: hypothetical protein MJH10_10825, partial [Epibacterium sp.]|nr:hypothetical protein [Epibacterium sp.]
IKTEPTEPNRTEPNRKNLNMERATMALKTRKTSEIVAEISELLGADYHVTLIEHDMTGALIEMLLISRVNSSKTNYLEGALWPRGMSGVVLRALRTLSDVSIPSHKMRGLANLVKPELSTVEGEDGARPESSATLGRKVAAMRGQLLCSQRTMIMERLGLVPTSRYMREDADHYDVSRDYPDEWKELCEAIDAGHAQARSEHWRLIHQDALADAVLEYIDEYYVSYLSTDALSAATGLSGGIIDAIKAAPPQDASYACLVLLGEYGWEIAQEIVDRGEDVYIFASYDHVRIELNGAFTSSEWHLFRVQ